MQVIRYSQGFKMQCVREVEAGKSCAFAVQRKYKIKGSATVMRWVRQLGSGRYGKLIRVEKAHEVNETAQLRSDLRRAKEALADTPTHFPRQSDASAGQPSAPATRHPPPATRPLYSLRKDCGVWVSTVPRASTPPSTSSSPTTSSPSASSKKSTSTTPPSTPPPRC